MSKKKKKAKKLYKIEYGKKTEYNLLPFTCSASSAYSAAKLAIRHWAKQTQNKYVPNLLYIEVTIL